MNCEMHPKTQQAYELLHNGVLAFARAEQQGLRIDVEYVEKQTAHLTRRIEKMERGFKETKFFRHWEHALQKEVNIYSNPQLSKFLYGVMKLQPEKQTTKGGGATDEEALKQLGIPELNDLLQIRKLIKVRDTYLGQFAREQYDGWLHPNFNLHLVTTFRSSSNSPNFQNIPKRDEESMRICRRAIFPRVGHQLMEVDFSGAEVRIAATYHKDEKLIYDVVHGDMHGDMAKEIFKLKTLDKNIHEHGILRQSAKNGFVFPQFYGDYYGNNAKGICEWVKLSHTRWKPGMGIEFEGRNISDHLLSVGIKSYDMFVEHLKEIQENFWGVRYKQYAKWKRVFWEEYKERGYVDMHTGFRCSGVMGENDVVNYPVQGAAFHCLLWVFTKMDEFLRHNKMDSKLVGQIHDSMVLDCLPTEVEIIARKAKQLITEKLPEEWKWIIVPMDADMEICGIDEPWSEKKHYNLAT